MPGEKPLCDIELNLDVCESEFTSTLFWINRITELITLRHFSLTGLSNCKDCRTVFQAKLLYLLNVIPCRKTDCFYFKNWGNIKTFLTNFQPKVYTVKVLNPRVIAKLSRLSLIARVNVVLNRTVVFESDLHFDNLCGSDLQSQRLWLPHRLSKRQSLSTTTALYFNSEDDYRTQVNEASITVNNNSPIQDYVHPDDQTHPTF